MAHPHQRRTLLYGRDRVRQVKFKIMFKEINEKI